MSLDWTEATLLRKFLQCSPPVTGSYICFACSFANDDYVEVMGSRMPNARREAVAKSGSGIELCCGHVVEPFIEAPNWEVQ